MWDWYNSRSDLERDSDDTWDLDRGSRGSSSERDPRDVFTRDVDLPRGREHPSAVASTTRAEKNEHLPTTNCRTYGRSSTLRIDQVIARACEAWSQGVINE